MLYGVAWTYLYFRQFKQLKANLTYFKYLKSFLNVFLFYLCPRAPSSHMPQDLIHFGPNCALK